MIDPTKFFEDDLSPETVRDAIMRIERECGLYTFETKIKRTLSSNQFLVETDNYWYKIYMNSKVLDHLVRSELAKQYQDLGLTWDFFTEERGGCFFDFERRQKFRVATPSQDGPFEKILLSFSTFYEKVEESLGFPKVLKQLKHHKEFVGVDLLKLTRNEFNKHNDYAFLDSQAILLDDANFCIVPLDKKADVVHVAPNDRFVVQVSHETFEFLPDGTSRPFYDNCDRVRVANSILRHKIYGGWVLSKCDNSNADLKSVDHIGSSKQSSFAPIKQNSCKSATRSSLDSKLSLKEIAEIEMKGSGREDTFKNFSYYDKKLDDDKMPTIINASLTKPCEDDFWKALDEVSEDNDNVWVVSEFNPKDSFLSDEELVNWSSHMKTIDPYYPTVSKLINVSATREVCERYLSGNIDFVGLSVEFGSMIGFVAPSIPTSFPSRTLFRKFLLKFARDHEGIYELCFLKHSLISKLVLPDRCMGNCDAEPRLKKSSCGHLGTYACYSDCEDCMLCDVERIKLSAFGIP